MDIWRTSDINKYAHILDTVYSDYGRILSRFFRYLASNNGMALRSGLGVIQVH